jgi:type II secretory pathway pseudopilin PulG
MTLCRSISGRSLHARRAATLLEMVLAMGLLVVLSSMTYWFYSSSLDTSRRGTEEAQRLRLARVVLDRIATEIRQAAAITADNRVGIRGEAERLWLSSYRVPSREQTEERSIREEPIPGEYDLTKVEYKIVRHPEILHKEGGYPYPLGLARIEILIPRPDSAETGEAFEGRQPAAGTGGESAEDGAGTGGGTDTGEESGAEGEEGADSTGGGKGSGDKARGVEELLPEGDEGGDVTLGPDINWEELYAPEIRYLRFCYYDGYKWWDSWDISGQSPLPQLVLVTIGFEPHPPFGEDFGLEEDRVNEEFCKCLNEEQLECEPLGSDEFSAVVRVPQADPLFRSRVSRETQSLVEELSEGLVP